MPATPAYTLRSPDSSETPFTQVLRGYNGFEPGHDWVDLRPDMELRIENAYYQPGMSRRGLNGFLGTEIAQYKVGSHLGLKLLSVQPMKDRPLGQLPVQELIPASQRHHRNFRFYYEIFFKRSGNVRGSVLLSANAWDKMATLSAELKNDPDAVCRDSSSGCTVFPEACSVSIEMEIVVNGEARNVIWGSTIASALDHPRNLQLWRNYNGRLTPVKLNSLDDEALKLPLLPGDHITTDSR